MINTIALFIAVETYNKTITFKGDEICFYSILHFPDGPENEVFGKTKKCGHLDSAAE